MEVELSSISMVPIDQTLHGSTDGNCFAASVASILELPLYTVPHTFGVNDDFRRWLAARGLSATVYDASRYVPPGYAIAAGPSKRFAGLMHACVAWNGSVVHDPHYSREGLPSGVVEYIVIHGPHNEALWFSGLAR